jgi:hypothetical protein
MSMRKAGATPSFEHYLHQLGANEKALVTVLKGHLVVEALLVEILQLNITGDTPWNWNFPKKTKKCVEFGFITSEQADALNLLNDLRNDFAHVLGKEIHFDSVFKLAQKAAQAGFDFSDDTIHLDRAKSEEWYRIDGGLIDILNSFFLDLAMILLENGGPDRTGG